MFRNSMDTWSKLEPKGTEKESARLTQGLNALGAREPKQQSSRKSTSHFLNQNMNTYVKAERIRASHM